MVGVGVGVGSTNEPALGRRRASERWEGKGGGRMEKPVRPGWRTGCGRKGKKKEVKEVGASKP